MNLNSWKEIYENNKKIDQEFINRYGNEEDYFKKNVIEFLVELGEYINETKCFKYWSLKKANKDKVLDEFADCITMILLFYNLSNIELDGLVNHIDNNNIFDVINYLYNQGSKLITNYSKSLVCDIFSNLLYLNSLLGYNEADVLTAIKKKHNIVIERLNSDY